MLSPYHYAVPGDLRPDSPTESQPRSLIIAEKQEVELRLYQDVGRLLSSVILSDPGGLLPLQSSLPTLLALLRAQISDSLDLWVTIGNEFSAELLSKTASDGEEDPQ